MKKKEKKKNNLKKKRNNENVKYIIIRCIDSIEKKKKKKGVVYQLSNSLNNFVLHLPIKDRYCSLKTISAEIKYFYYLSIKMFGVERGAF